MQEPSTWSPGLDSSDKFPDQRWCLVNPGTKQTFAYLDFGHPCQRIGGKKYQFQKPSHQAVLDLHHVDTRGHQPRFYQPGPGSCLHAKPIVAFLKIQHRNLHGAFSPLAERNHGSGHYSFGANDDGADLVETSHLMQGLITARQYFDGSDAAETTLRADINIHFTIMGLILPRATNRYPYWHWSPNVGWGWTSWYAGWNECLITWRHGRFPSTTFGIPRSVYDQGISRTDPWLTTTPIIVQLPLGSPYGGPLFFAHYSFLGINPTQLSDAYAITGRRTVTTRWSIIIHRRQQPAAAILDTATCAGDWRPAMIEGGYTAVPTNDLDSLHLRPPYHPCLIRPPNQWMPWNSLL